MLSPYRHNRSFGNFYCRNDSFRDLCKILACFALSALIRSIRFNPSEPVTPGTYATDGDVDGDGQTTILDALIVLNMAYGQIALTEAGLAHGDMDGDGVLRLADALAVVRKTVGL